MTDNLTVTEDEVSGEIALDVPPGTSAKNLEKLVTQALVEPLHRVAEELDVVLAAVPIKYARQVPGRDEEGRTRYLVRGRREGGKLVPAHKTIMYTRD